jgi:hypothetical protein
MGVFRSEHGSVWRRTGSSNYSLPSRHAGPLILDVGPVPRCTGGLILGASILRKEDNVPNKRKRKKERRKKRQYDMGRRWCRPLLHYAFLLLSCILPSLLVSGAQAPPSRCSSFQPQLWIRKHLLPSALDTRDRRCRAFRPPYLIIDRFRFSVTVIVEWQLTAPPTVCGRSLFIYLFI